jgi:protein involved in sex pheromone biosynthesis
MKFLVYSLVALTLLLSGCATSVMTSGEVVIEDEESRNGAGFSSSDREQIKNYYAQSQVGTASRNTSSGLVKRDVLPRSPSNKALPATLENRLSKLPNGYRRLVVGSDVVVINTRTRVIVDIYRNVGMN